MTMTKQEAQAAFDRAYEFRHLMNDQYTAASGYEELCRTLIASLPDKPAEAVALTWYDGEPPFPQNQEWFIAETIHGDRVVLKALPKEYSYDYTTADSTYLKATNIKRWMQFPDCEYLPPAAPCTAQSGEWQANVAIAYGMLWHVNAGMDAPGFLEVTSLTPERAAYEARKILREYLTNEQRGVGINKAREALLAPPSAPPIPPSRHAEVEGLPEALEEWADWEQGKAHTSNAALLREAARIVRGAGVPDIGALVDRFLAWPLPQSVCSDFCATNPHYPHQRTGTNLLTADEARQMLEYLLAASPAPGERT